MDPRLLSACGIMADSNEDIDASGRDLNGEGGSSTLRQRAQNDRSSTAPDGFPPLSCPFVIIDEACQSVEAASLVPIVSTNSCRSLVMVRERQCEAVPFPVIFML